MQHEFRMYVGPMFGGKTTRMLSQVERYRYQEEEIFLFKPWIDQRYDQTAVTTHSGKKETAIRVKTGTDIAKFVRKFDENHPVVIAVDEAFMIPGSGNILVNLFRKGHTVLVSSLQLSSDSTPYPEIMYMFPYATYVAVCPAVCPITKKDAYYTAKIGGRKDHGIEVGGADMYQPQCFEEFFKK